MHKKKIGFFAMPLLVSLCCSNSYAWNNRNSSSTQNLIAGICAAGAAVVGAITAVALVDWCFSETDDNLIIRFDRECSDADALYKDLIGYLEDSLHIYSLPINNASAIIRNYSEATLYHLATTISDSGVSQHSYRTSLYATRKQLRSTMSMLRKRIHALERKDCDYHEQKRLKSMRSLMHNAEKLMNHIDFFSEYLEHHKSYFNLYDTVTQLHKDYVNCFAIIEQGMYAETNLKNGIIGAISGRYPFSTFVNIIEPNIDALQFHINDLTHTYETARRYATITLNQLMWMRNVVVMDARFAQECYQQEQDRLHQLQLQAQRVQACAEWDRVDAMLEHNKILRERNHLEKQKIFNKKANLDVAVFVNV